MIAVWILLAIFGGLASVAGVIVAGILISEDKWTLPGSDMRRVKRAAADAEVARYREAEVITQSRIDSHMELRLDKALNPGPREAE